MRIRPLHLTVIASFAMVVALMVSAPALAVKPCWQRVINDWADGRIDQTYSAQCYRDAIKNAPADVRTYSSLIADLQAALAYELGGVVPGGQVGNPRGVKYEVAVIEQRQRQNPKQDIHHRDDDLFFFDSSANTIVWTQPFTASTADGIPLPLIILAGVAGLLLVAGTAGMISRKVQENRENPPPGAPPSA